MAEGNTFDGLSQSRPVLGDLTNRLGKRRISEIEKNGIQSFDINEKDAIKRICVSPRPCTEINSLKGNVISSIAKIPGENRDTVKIDTNSDDGHCLKGENVELGNSKSDDVSKSVDRLEVAAIDLLDSSREIDYSEDNKSPNVADVEVLRTVNSVAIQAEGCENLDLSKKNAIVGISEVSPEREVVDLDSSNPVQYVNIKVNDELSESIPVETSRASIETGEAKMMLEETINDNDNYKKDVVDCNVDSFVLSQSGECTVLPESQESRVFGADRSTGLKKGDECAHMSGGIDSINTCSCSFCTKAAHIWLDLNYQDIKARVSAMKRSQKEASILAERNCRNKATEKHGGESFTRVPKLESNLMHQWRSLFQNMASMWEQEANQLEANIISLADLREKCKNDLETINAITTEKH